MVVLLVINVLYEVLKSYYRGNYVVSLIFLGFETFMHNFYFGELFTLKKSGSWKIGRWEGGGNACGEMAGNRFGKSSELFLNAMPSANVVLGSVLERPKGTTRPDRRVASVDFSSEACTGQTQGFPTTRCYWLRSKKKIDCIGNGFADVNDSVKFEVPDWENAVLSVLDISYISLRIFMAQHHGTSVFHIGLRLGLEHILGFNF